VRLFLSKGLFIQHRDVPQANGPLPTTLFHKVQRAWMTNWNALPMEICDMHFFTRHSNVALRTWKKFDFLGSFQQLPFLWNLEMIPINEKKVWSPHFSHHFNSNSAQTIHNFSANETLPRDCLLENSTWRKMKRTRQKQGIPNGSPGMGTETINSAQVPSRSCTSPLFKFVNPTIFLYLASFGCFLHQKVNDFSFSFPIRTKCTHQYERLISKSYPHLVYCWFLLFKFLTFHHVLHWTQLRSPRVYQLRRQCFRGPIRKPVFAKFVRSRHRPWRQQLWRISKLRRCS
jgi:hypothetical protein